MVKDQEVFRAMQEGVPLKRYKKTILGKVHVVLLNPFSDEPEGVIMQGDPIKASDFVEYTVEIWTPKADMFFKRMNKKHFDAGRLVEVTKVPKIPKTANIITDEDIDEILEMKFFAFKKQLDSFTAEAPVFRLLNRARELEKSEKIVKYLEEKLSDLQLESFPTKVIENE